MVALLGSDGSLDSAGWPEGGDWLGSEPHRDQVRIYV